MCTTPFSAPLKNCGSRWESRVTQLDDATIDQAVLIFKRLPQTEQTVALYEMLRYIRSEIAVIKKKQIEIETELHRAKMYTEERLDTSERIRAILDKRFDAWSWFRDKVLPFIVIAILVAVFQLTWGK